jgi:hypothetical protein
LPLKALSRAFLFLATTFEWQNGLWLGLPEGRDVVGDFVLEDLKEFLVFLLTVG